MKVLVIRHYEDNVWSLCLRPNPKANGKETSEGKSKIFHGYLGVRSITEGASAQPRIIREAFCYDLYKSFMSPKARSLS